MGAVWSLITLPFRTTIATISAIFSIVFFSIRLTWTIVSLTHLMTYMFYVSLTTFVLAAAYEKEIPILLNKILPTRYQRIPMCVAMSVVTELPHYMIAFKVASILLARLFGVFNYWLGWLFLLVDILNVAGLCYFFVEGLGAVDLMVQQVPTSNKNNVNLSASSLISKSVRFLYRGTEQIDIYRNVQYYSLEDLRDPTLSSIQLHDEGLLDVYTTNNSANSKKLRPVVINVHGGGWTSGSKDQPCPLVRILAERGFVVCNINYRLAPKAPQPAGFEDVQKAIEWTRNNIVAFGGDAECIFLSGDSAGAHLALLATVKDAAASQERQPSMKGIKGTILVSGSLDVTDEFGMDRGRRDHFRDYVCARDASAAASLSPITPIVSGTATHIPPILAFHAKHDSLATYEDSKRLCAKVKELGYRADLVTLNGTHHAFMVFNSPRTIAMSEIAADWALAISKDNKKSQ